MRFEERELPPHAESVSPNELQEGGVYFSVTFVDRDMLIPTMEAVVFIGRNLQPDDSDLVYFQDIESYRRGVRYETATDDDYAQFSMGSETELGHIFDFEYALEELMRCSIRRREKEMIAIPILRAQGFESGEELPTNLPHERKVHSLRFNNIELQASFIAALRKAGLAFDVRDDGAVTCEADDWPAVNRAAGVIRDSCFRWYYSWWKDPVPARLFWEEMKAAGLPFEVEHHDDRLVFLLPRGNEDLHDVISGRVQMKLPIGNR